MKQTQLASSVEKILRKVVISWISDYNAIQKPLGAPPCKNY